MSQGRNHLPAVSPTGTQQHHAVVTNQLVKQYNRQDTDTFAPIYAVDTGTATAYAMAPVPGIKFYIVGQIFVFKAGNANSGTAPTLNVNGMGAGTITKNGGAALAIGDIAANSFNEVVVSSLTPTFELISAAAVPSKFLQKVFTITGAEASGTTTIPTDDNVPTSAQGDQYMSLAITPKSATSILEITVNGFWTNDTAGAVLIVAALFQDAGASALASGFCISPSTTQGGGIRFAYLMTSGTTSSTTFKVRAGSSGGTTTFNGQSATRRKGGSLASSIVIEETLP